MIIILGHFCVKLYIINLKLFGLNICRDLVERIRDLCLEAVGGVKFGESVIARCVWIQSGLVSIAVNEVLGGISLSYHVYERSGCCMEQKPGLVSYTSKFPKKKKIVLCLYIHASPTLFFSSQHTEIYRLYITLVWSALNLVKMTTGFFYPCLVFSTHNDNCSIYLFISFINFRG